MPQGKGLLNEEYLSQENYNKSTEDEKIEYPEILKEEVSEEEKKRLSEERKNWLYYTRNPLTDAFRDNLYKENYSLSVMLSFRGAENEKLLGVSLKLKDVFKHKEYKISDMESFLFHVLVGEEHIIEENSYIMEAEDFTQADARLIRFIDSIFREGEHIYESQKLWIKNELAEELIEILIEHDNVFAEGKSVSVRDETINAFIEGKLLEENGELVLDVALDFSEHSIKINYDKIYTFGSACSYIFTKGYFFKTKPSYAKTKRDLFPSPSYIEKKYLTDFYARVLPAIKKKFNVVIPEGVIEDDLKVFPAKAVVFLDYDGKSVFATIKFKYGKYTVDPYTDEATSLDGEIVTKLYRDKEKENYLCEMLGRYLDREGDFSFALSSDEKIFYLSYKALPYLQDKGWTFFYSEAFRTLRLKVKPKSINVKLTKDINFFQIDFSIEGVKNLVDMNELIKGAKEGKEYIRLQNGSFVPVDLEVMDYIAKIMSDTSLEKNENNSYLLPMFNAPYFVEELEKTHGLDIDLSEEAGSALSQITGADYDEELPKNLSGSPRPYQLTGYNWLRKLANMGLNGILADDMGLGKSFQTIASILKEYENGEEAPTLIVCPTSCVVNWYVEIGKFAKTLSTVVIQGSTDKREKLIRSLVNNHVGITSYSSLRRDVKRYSSIPLNYLILDEAQHIKNANTQNAKAAKALNSAKRLVLTGTPMENSISELWSLFDFLMPKFFPKQKDFIELYEIPILNDQNSEALETLKRKISPFILRRLKTEVLKELPPKNTNVVYCELTKEQKELYLSILDAARLEIFDAVKKKGFSQAKIEIFSALTRLRQVCCHPRLLDIELRKNATTSGKFNMFMEMINEVIDGGHNVIVFSQFTRMLKLIREALKRRKINYFYLDGATKDRMDLVNRFNAGEAPIFLLSLKAAGTGLTLTKADTVIHFDLWWNPAVEDQATDRAYRLGQKRTVTNYKLVTKGTIEEKILSLQEKKRVLIDNVIDQKSTSASSISWEEVKKLLE